MPHFWTPAELENHWTDAVVSGVEEMYTKNSPLLFSDTAEKILKLTDNILNNPTELKYRQIRLRNEKIRDIFKCTGAEYLMTATGWVNEVIKMEEKMLWDKTEKEFERLRLGRSELQKYLGTIKEKNEADPKKKDDAARRAILQDIEQSKQQRSEAAERKRQVQEDVKRLAEKRALEAKQAEESAPRLPHLPPAVQPQDQ
ncbi:hypothetical protein DIPPA_06175 [Diplonema papillatum]|nr:hypothetical protein DIPPA_06175 [Diplonema papillatum]